MRQKLIAAAIVSVVGFSLHASEKKAPAKTEKSAESVSSLEFRVELVDGKKHWLPADMTSTAGKHKLVLKNTLAEPHGFAIDGVLKEAIVVPANQSVTVDVEFPKSGNYAVTCHMHPAHVGASIQVK
jgi:hypothetical protein